MDANSGTERSKKDLIVKVALDLIKEEGFEGVTIRKIASLAKINVALIHYYFGSKDNLFNFVIQKFISSFQDSFTILDDTTLSPKIRLKRFLIQYVNTYKQYPFIGRKLVMHEPLKFENELEFMTFFKSIGLQKMRNITQEISGENDPQKLTIMVSHLLGAVFLPTLIEPLYESVTGYPFSNIETSVDILLEQYFSENH